MERNIPSMRRPLINGDPNSGPSFSGKRPEPPPLTPPLMPETKPNLDAVEYIEDNKKLESGMVRVGLPSNCVPYDFAPSDVFVKKFDVDALIDLTDARAGGNIITDMADIMDRYISVPIRDLTAPDQKFLMYWWRINSWPSTPYQLSWLSRYQNKNDFTIGNGSANNGLDGQYVNLQKTIQILKMTKAEYAEWKAAGLAFPTVRDAEALTGEMSPGTRFAMENAQYVYVDPATVEPGKLAEAKIEKLRAGGIELMEKIAKFSSQITHGVVEVVEFADRHFKAENAIQRLRQQALALNVLAVQGKEEGSADDAVRIQYLQMAQEYQQEADEIETALAEGKPVQPRKEIVTLKINVTSFFPGDFIGADFEHAG